MNFLKPLALATLTFAIAAAGVAAKPVAPKPVSPKATASPAPLSKFARAHLETMTISAPADQYFGRLKLSFLGINNTFRDAAATAGDHTTDASLVSKVGFADDALRDWEKQYPRDPQLARTYYLAIGADKKIWVQANQQQAWVYMNRITERFPSTYFAKLVKREMAIGFTEHYYTEPVPCATATLTATSTPSPEPTSAIATPTPGAAAFGGRRQRPATPSPTPAPTSTPTATPSPQPTPSPSPEPRQLAKGLKVQVLTSACAAPRTPVPSPSPTRIATPTPLELPSASASAVPSPSTSLQPSASPRAGSHVFADVRRSRSL